EKHTTQIYSRSLHDALPILRMASISPVSATISVCCRRLSSLLGVLVMVVRGRKGMSFRPYPKPVTGSNPALPGERPYPREADRRAPAAARCGAPRCSVGGGNVVHRAAPGTAPGYAA